MSVKSPAAVTRKNRQTGTRVTVATAAALKIKGDDAEKWGVRCEDHGTTLAVKSRSQRDVVARTPAAWCQACDRHLKAEARRERSEAQKAEK